MPDLTSESLLREYIEARDKASYWERQRLQLREILLPRLRESQGRIITSTGTALLRIEKRRFASVTTIDRLVMLSMLDSEKIAPAITESVIERVIAEGIPEVFQWENN
jgi:hypothetical protein